MGYASHVLEQALLEYKEPEEEDVCLYFDQGPEPRQGTIDLTIDHLLRYTGHYHGEGPEQTKSIGRYYLANREDLAFEERFIQREERNAVKSNSNKEEPIWEVGFFGNCSAIRNNAGTNDEGFTTYYADGLLTPENLDEWLAQNEFFLVNRGIINF